jgi:hypothetical protein
MLSTDLVGLKSPMQLDGKGDFAKVTGKDLEENDLMFLLSVERGELPWDYDYGTKIRELIHGHVASKVTATAIAFRECTDQVNVYAPSYRVTATNVEFIAQTVRVSVDYVERAKLDATSRTVTFEVNR